MDQPQMNEAVQQGVRRCLDASEPLAALESFLQRLRQSGQFGEDNISHIENAAKRILAIIYEPDGAEDARSEDRLGHRDE